MVQIVIIGCGVIGATIAYELSQISGLNITVLDRQLPAQAATGAALGVLMGLISQKVKGRAWQLRQTSMQRYETLIPELEQAIGHALPWNRQGIVKLCFSDADRAAWEQLAATRQTQGWDLQLWPPDRLQDQCPQLTHPDLQFAIYSPHDRQIDPTALTLALVTAAKQRGVTFRFDAEVRSWDEKTVDLADDSIAADWIILAAGLGSTALTRSTQYPVDIRPVLGQAVRVRLPQPLGRADFQPAVTGNDIHIVPLSHHSDLGDRSSDRSGNCWDDQWNNRSDGSLDGDLIEPSDDREYWVGATVEFPNEAGEVTAAADRWQDVWQGAIAFCPALQQGTIQHAWSGLRPRPFQRSAPVIEGLAGYQNVIVATGHYRNGVLLAPATADQVKQLLKLE